MTVQRTLIALAAAGLLIFAHRQYGWPGVAAVSGGLVMWLLLHVTRLMTIVKRAANRPIGHVDSAVMLNSKLHQGDTLLHVMAVTRSLGQVLTPEGEEPQVLRWTDAGGAWVEARFAAGRLTSWALQRPAEAGSLPPDAP